MAASAVEIYRYDRWWVAAILWLSLGWSTACAVRRLRGRHPLYTVRRFLALIALHNSGITSSRDIVMIATADEEASGVRDSGRVLQRNSCLL